MPVPIFNGNLVACGDGTPIALNAFAPGSPFASLDGTAPGPCSTAAYDRNLRTPYVETWNIDIQHSFTNNLSLDVAYLGNHGTKIFGTRDINAPAVGAGYSSRKPSQLAPVPDRLTYTTCSNGSRHRARGGPLTAQSSHTSPGSTSYRTRIGLTTTPCRPPDAADIPRLVLHRFLHLQPRVWTMFPRILAARSR